MDNVELYKSWQKSPAAFIEAMWGLKPQPLKKEYKERMEAHIKGYDLSQFEPEMFEPFIKGKHITWQQWLILLSIEFALKGVKSRKISIASGHGIGKSAILAMIVLWYLFCFKNAQVPCTAPSSDQMFDVLWKEIALWQGRMPEKIAELYEWQSAYIRIKESPQTWFARAKTARKESPEALAGIHSDFVLMVVDEASGVAQEIFNTAEGALTSSDILVLLIGNPTRTVGYFYDTHHTDKHNWQTFRFSSMDAPIVDKSYVDRIIELHGDRSDEYRIRVLGKFPKEDAMDMKGYLPLVTREELHYTDDDQLASYVRLGVDPGGQGSDVTAYVVRDRFRAIIVGEEPKSDEKSTARRVLTLMDKYHVRDHNVTIDNFGVGANVARELALSHDMNNPRVHALNVGDKSGDDDYVNIRAQAYWRMKQWIRRGGLLVDDKRWEELTNLRYRRELSGKMKIMGKVEMRKEGYKSPNFADALMLTFVKPEVFDLRQKATKPHWVGYGKLKQ
jgi:hypothetical protein